MVGQRSGRKASDSSQTVDRALLADLPTRSQCNVLYNAFVAGVYSLRPVVHLPLLLNWYNAFWVWYITGRLHGESCPNPQFMPLLWAVLQSGAKCASARAIEEAFPQQSRSELTALFAEKTTRSLNAQRLMSRPHLPGLIAQLLCLFGSLSNSGILADRLSLSLTVQLCQRLGVHREDPSLSFSAEETETRRRIWYQVFLLDGSLALTMGLPPVIPSDPYWDVKRPTELREELIGSREVERYLAGMDDGAPRDFCDDPLGNSNESRVNPVAVLSRLGIISQSTMHTIGAVLLSTKAVTPENFRYSLELVASLGKELRDCRARISDPFIQGRAAFDEFCRRSQTASSCQWYDMVPQDGLGSAGKVELRNTWIAFHGLARIWLDMILHKVSMSLFTEYLVLNTCRFIVWFTNLCCGDVAVASGKGCARKQCCTLRPIWQNGSASLLMLSTRRFSGLCPGMHTISLLKIYSNAIDTNGSPACNLLTMR